MRRRDDVLLTVVDVPIHIGKDRADAVPRYVELLGDQPALEHGYALLEIHRLGVSRVTLIDKMKRYGPRG